VLQKLNEINSSGLKKKGIKYKSVTSYYILDMNHGFNRQVAIRTGEVILPNYNIINNWFKDI
jgi:hypothetical protein